MKWPKHFHFVSRSVGDKKVSERKEREEIVQTMQSKQRSQVKEKYGDKIKKLKDGRYHIRYKGKQIFKISYERVIDEIIKIDNQEKDQESVETLDSIAKSFFEYRFQSTAGGTYSKDKHNYETFIKGTAIATKDISKITLDDGTKWSRHCSSVKPNMKCQYFKNVRGTLNQMFKYAISKNLITQNPVAEISIHRDHLAPETVHKDSELFFDDDERKQVCALAYEDANATHSAVPLAIPLLFNTGLRDGELCALKWRDIEEDGEELHIQAEMVEDRNEENKFLGYKYVSHTKTRAGNRAIPLSQKAKETLALVKKFNIEHDYPVGDDDFIFLRTYRGNVQECTTRCFESRIKKYCKAADMTVLKSQHDIRRTFATNLFHEGMDPKEIQALMGHENIEQTYSYIKKKGTDKTKILHYLDTISSEQREEIV
jgi:integrase